MTAAEFKRNLEAIRGVLDPGFYASVYPCRDWEAHPEPGGLVSGPQRQHETDREGRATWYSHKTEDGWCKGKGR